jgi:hypothetical protein
MLNVILTLFIFLKEENLPLIYYFSIFVGVDDLRITGKNTYSPANLQKHITLVMKYYI